jgi:hypothetical protein
LWWHPHNFGTNLAANLAFLRAILNHFRILQDRYGMRSMTMGAVADEVLGVDRSRDAADMRRRVGPYRHAVPGGALS